MSKEIRKVDKAIESFKNYIKTIENRQEYLYENEDFYREEIEQNELFLKMLHETLNYIDNSIPKQVIEKKIAELKRKSGGNVFHIQQTINAEIRLLQEILEVE